MANIFFPIFFVLFSHLEEYKCSVIQNNARLAAPFTGKGKTYIISAVPTLQASSSGSTPYTLESSALPPVRSCSWLTEGKTPPHSALLLAYLIHPSPFVPLTVNLKNKSEMEKQRCISVNLQGSLVMIYIVFCLLTLPTVLLQQLQARPFSDWTMAFVSSLAMTWWRGKETGGSGGLSTVCGASTDGRRQRGGTDNNGLNWRDHLSLCVCVCVREKKENMISLETEMRK